MAGAVGEVAVRFTAIYDAYICRIVSLSNATNCGKDFYGITLQCVAQPNPWELGNANAWGRYGVADTCGNQHAETVAVRKPCGKVTLF